MGGREGLRGGRAYLHPGLGEVDPARQVLPDEGVGVVRPLEHPLQSLQLAAVERGPVPPLFPLLLLLRVQLLVCKATERVSEPRPKKTGRCAHANTRTHTLTHKQQGTHTSLHTHLSLKPRLPCHRVYPTLSVFISPVSPLGLFVVTMLREALFSQSPPLFIILTPGICPVSEDTPLSNCGPQLPVKYKHKERIPVAGSFLDFLKTSKLD